jgi:hypothetical protein
MNTTTQERSVVSMSFPLPFMFAITVSQLVRRGRLDKLSQKAHFVFSSVVLSKPSFESGHLVDAASETCLRFMKLDLQGCKCRGDCG